MFVGSLFTHVNNAGFTKKGDFALGLVSVAVFALIQTYTDNSVNMHLIHYGNLFVFLMTGSLASIGILWFCKLLPSDLKILSFVGKKTLDIMVLHYPPMPFMALFAFVAGLVFPEKNVFVVFLISVLLTATLCFAGVVLDKVRSIIRLPI